MSLDNLNDDLETQYSELGGELAVDLDRETRNELAMLTTALEPDDTDELLRRAVHMLFQTAVETGNLDFHLRSQYDTTYDEYVYPQLKDTYNAQSGGVPQPGQHDDRRYQF